MINRRFGLIFTLPILLLGLFFIPSIAFATCYSDAEDVKDACDLDAVRAYDSCISSGGVSLATCDLLKETYLQTCEEEYDDAIDVCDAAESDAESTATAEQDGTELTAIPGEETELPTTSATSAYDDIMSQGIIFAGICDGPAPLKGDDTCACRAIGDCSLEDIMQVVVNISSVLLGLIGSMVLLMFMYGGFLWLTSQGKSDAVKKGQDTMVNAVIGLIIVFGAYAAISIVISVIKTGEIPEGTNVEDILKEDPDGSGDGIDASGLINTTSE